MKLITKFFIKRVSKQIKAGKIELALKTVNKYLNAPFENNFYLGICYFEMGDWNQAEHYLKLAWNLQESAMVALVLGEVYLQQDNWQEALLVLEPFQQSPEVKQLIDTIHGGYKQRQEYRLFFSLLRQAMGFMREKRYSQSIQSLMSALPYSKDKEKVYNQIGGIYFNFLKDRVKAEEYFRRAYEGCPNNKSYQLNYARVKLH